MASFYRGIIPIIDDSTSTDTLFDPVIDGKRVKRGLVPRDYTLYPPEMFAPPSEMKVIDPSEWDARYDEQEAQESSLEHLYLQDIKNPSPVFINLDQDGDGYCLLPSSLVLLADGSYLKIADVTTADYVVTAEGNIGKVVSIPRRQYQGDIIGIGIHSYLDTLWSTPEHPILTPRGYIPIKDVITDTEIKFNGREWRRVTYVNAPKSFSGQVFNLSVEGDNSYVANGIGVHNCWAYSTGHGIMLNRMFNNMPLVRLNPHATAAIIKHGQDEGGWCGLSAEFATANGYAVEGNGEGQWPLHSRNLKYDTPQLRAEMRKHKVVESWVDPTRDVYDVQLQTNQYATSLFLNNPTPSDFNWWSHSVCALRWVRIERGSWGPLILNSWKGWGRFGLAVLQGYKGRPDSCLSFRTTTPSMS